MTTSPISLPPTVKQVARYRRGLNRRIGIRARLDRFDRAFTDFHFNYQGLVTVLALTGIAAIIITVAYAAIRGI